MIRTVAIIICVRKKYESEYVFDRISVTEQLVRTGIFASNSGYIQSKLLSGTIIGDSVSGRWL